MANVRKVRLPGKIAAKIAGKIVSGRLLPGTTLDGEIEASRVLKVSRLAYREAIQILVAKGLVQSRPKFGTRVTPPTQWHLLDPDVLGWMFAKEPPRELLASLFELRKMFEPEAAALAAKRHVRHLSEKWGAPCKSMTKDDCSEREHGRRAGPGTFTPHSCLLPTTPFSFHYLQASPRRLIGARYSKIAHSGWSATPCQIMQSASTHNLCGRRQCCPQIHGRIDRPGVFRCNAPARSRAAEMMPARVAVRLAANP